MQEIDFISQCPVQGCSKGNKPFHWTHYDCGGKEKINQYGQIRCCKCGEKGDVINWKFDCKRHEYDEDSYQSKDIALIVGSTLIGDDQVFVNQIVKAISKQILTVNCGNKPNEQNEDVTMDDIGQDEFNDQHKVNIIMPGIHQSGNGGKMQRNLNQTQQQHRENQIKEIDLICKCPEKQCKKKGNRKEIKWKHNKCSTSLKITTHGFVKCKKCKTSQHLLFWKFTCSNSTVSLDERKSPEHISYYLEIGSGLKTTDQEFSSMLMQKIMEEYNKRSS